MICKSNDAEELWVRNSAANDLLYDDTEAWSLGTFLMKGKSDFREDDSILENILDLGQGGFHIFPLRILDLDQEEKAKISGFEFWNPAQLKCR